MNLSSIAWFRASIVALAVHQVDRLRIDQWVQFGDIDTEGVAVMDADEYHVVEVAEGIGAERGRREHQGGKRDRQHGRRLASASPYTAQLLGHDRQAQCAPPGEQCA